MTQQINTELEALQEIKRIMAQSGKFISLSGWSGVVAGLFALFGAAAAGYFMQFYGQVWYSYYLQNSSGELVKILILIGLLTFIGAFVSAFVFTYYKAKKLQHNVWGAASFRLFYNVAIPLLAGALVIFRMHQLQQYQLTAPCCLLFYGLALINAAKYTITDIKYLGYTNLILGIINLWWLGQGIIFWSLGFGVSHIIYGIIMWHKYDKNV